MNGFDEFEITDSIAAQSRREIGSELLELLQVFPQLELGDVVDNVQQCDTGTSIVDSLKPFSTCQREEVDQIIPDLRTRFLQGSSVPAYPGPPPAI